MAIIPTLEKTINLPYKQANSYFFQPPYLYAVINVGAPASLTCKVYRTNINTGITNKVYEGGIVFDNTRYLNFGAFFVYNDEYYYLVTTTYSNPKELNIVNLTQYTYNRIKLPYGDYTNKTFKAYVLDNKVYFTHLVQKSGGGLGTDRSSLFELNMDTIEVQLIKTTEGIDATESAGFYGVLMGKNKSLKSLPRISTDYTTIGVSLDRQLINSGDEWYSFKDGYFASVDINTLVETPILNVGGKSPLYVEDTNKYLIVNESTLSIYDLTDYKITFNFKDNNGDIFETLNGKPPITKINLNYVGVGVTVVITFLDGTEQEIYFEVPEIKDYQFYGFNVVPNAKEAIIVEGDNTIYLSNNTTFYPVYRTYKPPSRVFQLNLYKNSAEPNRVDKTNYLTQIGTLYGAFRDETSITNMVITIQQAEFPQFNYVYIPTFHRYYFVTDITSIRQNLWEISLSIDVLMSYKDAIKSCYAFVDRNEFTSNPMLIDKKRVIEQGIDIEVHEVLNDVFVDYPETDIDDTQFPLADTDTFFVLNGYKIKSRHHYD